MLPRYFKYLTDSIRNNANEAFELCKEVKDLEKAQALESLFYKYEEDAAELIKFITIQESEESDGGPYKTSISRLPYEEATGRNVAFNVDAPCFIPVCSTDDESSHSYKGCPSQWAELSEACHHMNHVWPAQHIVHAQFPFPHHYHIPTHHSPSLLYSGLPVFPHYSGPAVPLLPQSQGGPPVDHTSRRQYHSHHRVRHRELKNELPKPTRKIQNVEGTLDVVLPNVNNTLPEKMATDIVDSSCNEGRAEAVDLTPTNLKVTQPLKTESGCESVFISSEQLQEFPALSSDRPVKKMKSRFPPVKYQRKVKLTLADLYKRFGTPDVEEDLLSRNSKNNLSSEYRFNKKTPMTGVIAEEPCPCIDKVNLFRRGRSLYEKVPEEVLDEADGWKKVKPRFSRNRDNLKQIRMKENLLGVYPCKVCQSTYRGRYETSNRKHVNVRRNSHFTSSKYGSPRNNCTREAIPTHVLGLHYNNVLVPSHITHKCSKLNNEVNSAVSKNGRVPFVDSKLMPNTPGTISEQVLNLVSKSHTPAPSFVDSNYMDEMNHENLDLAIGVCDNSFGTNNVLPSSFLDEDFSLQNNFPTLSTTISCSGIVDNEDECNIDSYNMDLFDEMSIDEDNTVNDAMPVVEDAHDMHEEFMKYLNCSTWPTQMDEIDKFESMIAGNNPSDPVLMYPSVSVEQFTEFIQRHPDEAQAFRREITFKLKKIRETESKQQQAYEKRLELLKSKTAKVRGFVQKVKDVQLAQDKLALKRKHQIDEKLRKAEENRKNYLSIIRRKAHDEEEKLKEIAFINELEAQNRRHDSLALRQEHEDRLQAISDERQRRAEEKAAKEAAAEERRRVLEAERQERLQKMAEARRKKEETIDRKNQEREKERLEAAREKQREREERLLARCALQRATAEELQKRIQQKQEDSARRHEENIESIRQRALEVGLHRNVEDTTNISAIAKTEEPVTVEVEVPQETPETLKLRLQRKKKLRKIKLRLASRGSEFLTTYPISSSNLSTSARNIADLNSDLPLESAVIIVNSIKNEFLKSVKNEETAFEDFAQCRGLVPLTALVHGYISKSSYSLSSQDFQLIAVIMDIFKIFIVQGGDDHPKYFVYSNSTMIIVDLLRFLLAGSKKNVRFSQLIGSALDLLSQSLNTMSLMDSRDRVNDALIADTCSYIANSGAMEGIISMCKEMVIEDDKNHSRIIVLNCIDLFGALVNPRFDSADIANLLLITECFGTVPLLYEGLQKIAITDELPYYITRIIDFYRRFSALDLTSFQDVLGDDSMALQTRAIASNLLNYSKAKPNNDLLHAIILLVGYFAMRNGKNQTLLQSGQQPTVLQQLVNLPFRYFCDGKYTEILYPTLYVCSFNNPTNRAIVENDMSFSQLESYIFSDRGINNPMMKKFHELDER